MVITIKKLSRNRVYYGSQVIYRYLTDGISSKLQREYLDGG